MAMSPRVIIAVTVVVAVGVVVSGGVWRAFGDTAVFKSFAGFKNFVGEVRDLVFAIAQVIAILLLIALVAMLVRWMSGQGEGTVILPFDNATGDQKHNGKGLSDSLIAELHRIYQIYQVPPEGVPSERLALPRLVPSSESLASTIENVGTIGVGETTVSIGRLLATLKRLWPVGDPGAVITGSLQRYGRVVRLVARMEHREIRAWEVSKKIETDDQIPGLVADLAFKIVHDLSRATVRAKTWIAFRHFTEALSSYQRYRQTGKAEDLDAARRHCVQAVRAEPSYSVPFGLLYNIGVIYFDGQRYDHAESAFRVASTPRDDARDASVLDRQAHAFNGVGLSLASQDHVKKKEAAIPAYRKAIELAPAFVAAWHNLGSVYADLGEIYMGRRRGEDARVAYQEAIAAYQKAIGLAPKDPDPWHGLGNVYYDLGNAAQAIDAYRNAIKLNPKDADFRYSLGLVCDTQAETREEAITAYQEATKLNPSDPDIWNNLGVVYADRGRTKDAVAAYRTAIELNPKDAAPWYNLGLVYADREQTQRDAIAAYRTAARLSPKDADIWDSLGDAYVKIGRRRDAKAAYRRAIRLDPGLADARASLAALVRGSGATPAS